MGYEIQYVSEEGMVAIKVFADIDPEAGRAVTREAIRLIKENHCRRILCDTAGMRLSMSVPDLYQIVEQYHTEGMPYGTRIAIVAPEQRTDIEKLEIFGIAALNRGYTVRLFGQVDQARQWLLHESPDKSVKI